MMDRHAIRESITRLQSELNTLAESTGAQLRAPVAAVAQGVMCQRCGRYTPPDDVTVWLEESGAGIDERGDVAERGAPIAVLAAVSYCPECTKAGGR